MSSGVVQELAGQVPGEAGSPGPGGRDQGPGGVLLRAGLGPGVAGRRGRGGSHRGRGGVGTALGL